MLLSNGWLAVEGELRNGALRYGTGDVVGVRWDKNMEMVEWEVAGRKQVVKFQYVKNMLSLLLKRLWERNFLLKVQKKLKFMVVIQDGLCHI